MLNKYKNKLFYFVNLAYICETIKIKNKMRIEDLIAKIADSTFVDDSEPWIEIQEITLYKDSFKKILADFSNEIIRSYEQQSAKENLRKANFYCEIGNENCNRGKECMGDC